jgi:uncharacterized Zn-binding protein involved in type VI secretion
MPGPPVSIGCMVLLSPGAAGAPDSGVILTIPQASLVANGLPLAVSGSICQMINSVSGVPYPLPITSGGSTSVTVNGAALLRMGDVIPAGPGMLTLLGPPAVPFVTDTGA